MTFTPDSYAAVLERLVDHYGRTWVVPACPPWPSRGVLLRHDVDLMLTPAITVLADVEEALGVRSCWFVRVDGHYNPHSRESRAVLTRLTAAGHKVGLHYDCATATPESIERDRRLLAESTTVCEAITGHRPTIAARDPFRTHKCNPGSIVGHMYIADSRREPLALPAVFLSPQVDQAVRDRYIPPVLQVNTHPEHYVTDLPLAEHYAALADELAVSLAA